MRGTAHYPSPMRERYTTEHVEAWRRDGALVIPRFFDADEVAAVAADFREVFGQETGADQALQRAPGGSASFSPAQFKTIDSIPFACSSALNLIGLHPALVAFARARLETDDVHLYQCQAWAKYTGAADYEQPFHCDFLNHTLTVPDDDDRQNSVTIICYFTDATEALGPTHYVVRPDSDRVLGQGAASAGDRPAVADLDTLLAPFDRSTAAPAGSIFAYGIDVYHRGSNLTAPRGHRYTVTACFKRAGDEAIGFTAWPVSLTKPWGRIFEHATPDQLACLGVPRPGHPFWTATTIARNQARHPGWDAAPYREALERRAG